jgi:hypothetical protein
LSLRASLLQPFHPFAITREADPSWIPAFTRTEHKPALLRGSSPVQHTLKSSVKS